MIYYVLQYLAKAMKSIDILIKYSHANYFNRRNKCILILTSFVTGSRGGTPRGRGGRGGTPRGGSRGGGANAISLGTGGTGANKKKSFDD